MFKPQRWTPALFLSLASLAGCVGGGEGTVGFFVTDAPTDDWSRLNVTFSKVEIHKAGADNSSGWVTLVEERRTVDFIALHANNTAEALGFAKVDAARYTQVRLTIDSVVGWKKSDGSNVTFKVPSGVLRTSKSFEVKSGGNTTLTLEIDLSQSISCHQNNTDCTFKPVVGKVEAA